MIYHIIPGLQSPPHYMLIILQGHRQHMLFWFTQKRLGNEAKEVFIFISATGGHVGAPQLKSQVALLFSKMRFSLFEVSAELIAPVERRECREFDALMTSSGWSGRWAGCLERRLCSRSLSPRFDSLIWNSPECLSRVLTKIVCNFNRQRQPHCWELQGILRSFFWVSVVF